MIIFNINEAVTIYVVTVFYYTENTSATLLHQCKV